MTDELIMQWGESNKALMKAKMTQEFTESRRELEKVTEAVNQRLDYLNITMDSRINIESEKQNSKLDTFKATSSPKKQKDENLQEIKDKKILDEIVKINERIDQLEEINLDLQGNVLEKEMDKGKNLKKKKNN